MTDAIGVHTYTYDAANRLTSIQLPDSSIQAYTWDNRGNLLADGTFTYTYSAAGRMVRAENLTATLVYTYNADGLRVAQSQSVSSVQSVDTFTWGWATPVPELLSDGESLYLIGYDTLGWQSGTDWTFVLPDALGSVRQETDAVGAVSAVREWSPYGEELGGAQAGLGFTGEWWDDAVGLTYLRARWYQLVTGRFTSRDPWEGNITRPNTLNGFSYVTNNPINLVDPLGLCELYPYFDYECWPLLRTNATQERLRSQTDPLYGYDYQVIVQEASRFGLPAEFLASVLAAEVKYDTGWQNKIYDVHTTFLDWLQPDYLFLFTSDEPCTWPQVLLELWHYYYGLGPLYLNPKHSFGEGPAPGIGNIHSGVAADVEQYFVENYADENLLPSFKYNWRRLELLHRFEWNVRYVAAYLRQLSDIRTGKKKPHLDLTDTDMKMIFTAYHADLAYCFIREGEGKEPVSEFQQAICAANPACDIYSWQLDEFLSLYRGR
ncbi:MAG: RHS repeat-associated core domain-containing protein [Anaerolineae bacterium]